MLFIVVVVVVYCCCCYSNSVSVLLLLLLLLVVVVLQATELIQILSESRATTHGSLQDTFMSVFPSPGPPCLLLSSDSYLRRQTHVFTCGSAVVQCDPVKGSFMDSVKSLISSTVS